MSRNIPGGPINSAPELPSIPEMIHNTAAKFPDRIAVREPTELGQFRTITYRQFAANIDWLARGIKEIHSEPVVAIIGKNTISWYSAYLATHRAGGIVVPLDPALHEADIHTIIHYSGANIIFHDLEYMDWVEDFKEIIPITMNAGFKETELSFSEVLRNGRISKEELPSVYDSDKVAVISYTSGTTGVAKGVMHSQNSILSNVRQIINYVYIDEKDTMLSVLPVHHMYEGTAGFLLPLSVGAEIAIAHGLRYVADDLVNTKATVVLAVPLVWETMYRRIMSTIKSAPLGKTKLKFGMFLSKTSEHLGVRGFRKKVFGKVHDKFGGHLRLLVSGGAGIDVKVVEGFEKLGFKILQGYGLTETAPIISVNRENANKYGSVGPVVFGMQCRIEGPDKSGIGEVVVKGPNVMLGYYGNEKATSQVLSSDKWFNTGDFGYLDKEGFLFITGRKKNVIIAKNGKNVYPEELETRLNRFIHIKECMVFGRVSETKGEEICVIIVPDRDLLISEADNQSRKITIQDELIAVKKAVKTYNSSCEIYKRISSFIIYEDDLPKTTTKKIKRNIALKEAGMTPSKVFKP